MAQETWQNLIVGTIFYFLFFFCIVSKVEIFCLGCCMIKVCLGSEFTEPYGTKKNSLIKGNVGEFRC